MKNLIKSTLLFTFFLIVHLQARQEISSIKEVAQFLDAKKSILVIFDIDNTLLEASTDLGSDQWFSYRLRQYIEQGMHIDDAVKQILPLHFYINLLINLITTEPTLADDILSIKNNCEHVICLTARSLPLAERTLQQLHQNNLYFHIPELDDIYWIIKQPCLYKQGCLFCGQNCKGDVLSAFLDKINYKPDLIIFIDDKDYNLQAVEDTAHKLNIEYIGLRYNRCDERVQNFDYEKTEIELQNFLLQHPIKHNEI